MRWPCIFTLHRAPHITQLSVFPVFFFLKTAFNIWKVPKRIPMSSYFLLFFKAHELLLTPQNSKSAGVQIPVDSFRGLHFGCVRKSQPHLWFSFQMLLQRLVKVFPTEYSKTLCLNFNWWEFPSHYYTLLGFFFLFLGSQIPKYPSLFWSISFL